jgi:hypothetical protein
MILGVAPTAVGFGWALLDDAMCSFVAVGVVAAEPVRRGTLSQLRRANAQALALAVRMRDCHTVVVERVEPIPTAWHILIGSMSMCSPVPRQLTVERGRWQREVLPNASAELDYDALAHAAATYLLANHPRAAAGLKAIAAKPWRGHANDAAMLALMGALRVKKCQQIEAR